MRRNGENDLENLFAESNIDDYLPLSQPIFRNKSVIFAKLSLHPFIVFLSLKLS
jgi:hypothetical protein